VALRARDEAEAELLERDKLGRAFSPEKEIALGILNDLFDRLKKA
jgi:hypothetical protein